MSTSADVFQLAARLDKVGFSDIVKIRNRVMELLVYYNTPQNPSGVVFTRAEAEAVAALARERDLIVIADEAYEDFVYDGGHVSIASLDG